MVIARRGKLHELQTEWARKYGPIVRIAPNEVLITSVSAIDIIHGPRSTATKQHTFYDYMQYHGVHDLDSIHDRREHRARRKVWDLALSNKNMDLYELNARESIHVWLDKASTAAVGQDPLNLSLYMSLLPFDNMTRTGFSVDSGAVKLGTKNRLIHLIEAPFARIAASAHSTWPWSLMKKLRLLEKGQFNSASYEICLARENNSSDPKDIMEYFLDDFRSDQPKAFHDRHTVYADAQAIMVGGTGTLSALLTHCFYYLARSPAMRNQLRQELAPVFGKSCPGEFDYKDLISLPCLDSVVSETLRMHSPACNNGPRTTTEDTNIEGTVLPKDVVVYVGIHSIQRSPKYFVCPDEWKPERWTTRQDLILDKQAYHPFLKGPFSCVGKSLALMVAKLVLSYTISLYDFEFPPGGDGSSFLSGCKNQLIVKPGKLECVFTRLRPSSEKEK
ncbi:hypothetical protein FJTKL_08128 [Diaporthe vaccinii]|uniref:Cytochrome P450 n=1 Tax=Diaporthe vaccinii TaxID=105482 RepID=A0ABR4ESP0_9PEZI